MVITVKKVEYFKRLNDVSDKNSKVSTKHQFNEEFSTCKNIYQLALANKLNSNFRSFLSTFSPFCCHETFLFMAADDDFLRILQVYKFSWNRSVDKKRDDDLRKLLRNEV